MDATRPSVPLQTDSGVPPALLDPRQLYHHDPLFVLLRDRLHLPNYIVIVLAVVISVVILFVWAFLSGIDFVTAYIVRSLLQAFIAFPLLAYLCLRLPSEIANLFNTLQSRGVIGPPLFLSSQSGSETQRHASAESGYQIYPDTLGGAAPASYEAFLAKLAEHVDSLWGVVIAGALVIGYWVYRLVFVENYLMTVTSLQSRGQQPAIDPHQFWFRVGLLFLYSFPLYAASIAIFRLLATLFYTRVLFRYFKIHINPLHPDGSGGLSVLGSLIGVSVGIVTTIGLIALLVNISFLAFLRQDALPFSVWEAVVIGVAYLLLAPTLSVGWLLTPHQVMMEARDEVLQPLADQFQATILDTLPTEDEGSDQIKQGTDRMSELKRRYDLLMDLYPIWPAQIQVIRRQAATISLPAVISFLSLLPGIVSAVTTFLNQSGWLK